MRIKRTGDDCCGPWENIAQQIAAIWTAIYNKVGSVNGKLPVNNGELELTASDVDAYDKDETDGLLAQKQNVLTAGANITIEDDVISATGGGASYEAGSGIAISDENVISNTAPNVKSDWNAASGSDAEILNKPSLATVATSGSYTDLTDKPSIPAAQVQSDWDQSDNTQVDYIKNKPTIPAAQVQADWDEADNTAPDYIKNKPTIPVVPTDIVEYSRGSGTPTTTPARAGLIYFDYTNNKGFISKDNNGSYMWQQLGNGFITEGTAPPGTAPTALNQIFIDAVNKKFYISHYDAGLSAYEWVDITPSSGGVSWITGNNAPDASVGSNIGDMYLQTISPPIMYIRQSTATTGNVWAKIGSLNIQSTGFGFLYNSGSNAVVQLVWSKAKIWNPVNGDVVNTATYASDLYALCSEGDIISFDVKASNVGSGLKIVGTLSFQVQSKSSSYLSINPRNCVVCDNLYTVYKGGSNEFIRTSQTSETERTYYLPMLNRIQF